MSGPPGHQQFRGCGPLGVAPLVSATSSQASRGWPKEPPQELIQPRPQTTLQRLPSSAVPMARLFHGCEQEALRSPWPSLTLAAPSRSNPGGLRTAGPASGGASSALLGPWRARKTQARTAGPRGLGFRQPLCGRQRARERAAALPPHCSPAAVGRARSATPTPQLPIGWPAASAPTASPSPALDGAAGPATGRSAATGRASGPAASGPPGPLTEQAVASMAARAGGLAPARASKTAPLLALMRSSWALEQGGGPGSSVAASPAGYRRGLVTEAGRASGAIAQPPPGLPARLAAGRALRLAA